jgi:hypothetical protein
MVIPIVPDISKTAAMTSIGERKIISNSVLLFEKERVRERGNLHVFKQQRIRQRKNCFLKVGNSPPTKVNLKYFNHCRFIAFLGQILLQKTAAVAQHSWNCSSINYCFYSAFSEHIIESDYIFRLWNTIRIKVCFGTFMAIKICFQDRKTTYTFVTCLSVSECFFSRSEVLNR